MDPQNVLSKITLQKHRQLTPQSSVVEIPRNVHVQVPSY